MKFTDERIIRSLWRGLHSILYANDLDDTPWFDPVDEAIMWCYKKQTKLGWHNIIYGWLIKNWGTLNADLKNIIDHNDGATWTTQVTGEIWKVSLSLWIKMNMTVHWTTTGIYLVQLEVMSQYIDSNFQIIQYLVLEEHQWLLLRDIWYRKKYTYNIKFTWRDHVRRLYPEYYESIKNRLT